MYQNYPTTMQNSKILPGQYPGPSFQGRKVCFLSPKMYQNSPTAMQNSKKKNPGVEPAGPRFWEGMWKLPHLENMSGYATVRMCIGKIEKQSDVTYRLIIARLWNRSTEVPVLLLIIKWFQFRFEQFSIVFKDWRPSNSRELQMTGPDTEKPRHPNRVVCRLSVRQDPLDSPIEGSVFEVTETPSSWK